MRLHIWFSELWRERPAQRGSGADLHPERALSQPFAKAEDRLNEAGRDESIRPKFRPSVKHAISAPCFLLCGFHGDHNWDDHLA